MSKFLGFNYEKYPDAAASIAESIKTKLQQLTKKSEVNSDWVDLIVIYTSNKFSGSSADLKKELVSLFEDLPENKLKAEEFVNWLEKEIPKQYNEMTNQAATKEAADEPRLEKRSEDQQKPNRAEEKKGNILDRIKPRGQPKTKQVKAEAGEEQQVAEAPQQDDEHKGDKPKKDPSKVRCNFWPSCKKPDCPFAHPTEQVTSLVSSLSEMRLRQQVHLHSSIGKFCSLLSFIFFAVS